MGRYVWECDGKVEKEVFYLRVIMSEYASEYDVCKDGLGSGGAASLSS